MAVNRSRNEAIQLEREEAWLGDAALALVVREWILAREGRMEAALFAELTSNQFLSRLGIPTAVEAEIGRAYRDGGLTAARAWIDARLIPHFERNLNRRHGRS
jgi:dsRNA-specific ribonuclease